MPRGPLALLIACLLMVPATAGAATIDAGGDVASVSGLGAKADAMTSSSRPLPPNKPVPSRAKLAAMIDRAASQYGVESDLVHAVVMAESAYDPHAVSRVGAVGLMQVMPETAADYGVSSLDELFDPKTNIRTGVRHLKRLLSKYSIGKAVMAYNAGEGALERGNGFVTYPETQRYTHKVLSAYLRKKGIKPYSLEARALTGVTLTPAMAQAGGRAGTSGRLLRHIDVSRLSLRVRPTLSSSALDPANLRAGPESQPMFSLEPRRTD